MPVTQCYIHSLKLYFCFARIFMQSIQFYIWIGCVTFISRLRDYAFLLQQQQQKQKEMRGIDELQPLLPATFISK